MRAVILERNKLVGRKVARLFMATGATAVNVEEPGAAGLLLGEADVLCADSFDADFVAEQVRAHPQLHGVLWTAEPLRRSLRHMIEAPRLHDVLGRRDFESPPRAWEVLMVARRLLTEASRAKESPVLASRGPASDLLSSRLCSEGSPPLGAYLDWGFSAIDLEVRSTADRDVAVARVQDMILGLQAPKRVAEMFGELAHELIMNAVYDAPVDAQGRPKYAADRKADIRLADDERPAVRMATDGSKLVLQVRDPFGRLERHHVFDGLARGLAGGELDRSHGGAGLGMLVCHNATSALMFDVARGRHTEVTAVFELDINLRELRTQAKSLHFWST